MSGSQRQQRPLMRRQIGRLGLPQGDDERGSTVTSKSWVYRITSEIYRSYMQKMLLQSSPMLQFDAILKVLTPDKPIVWFTGAELHGAERSATSADHDHQVGPSLNSQSKFRWHVFLSCGVSFHNGTNI